MSLPIVLAIVLTAAILAWGAVYLVIRHRREVALRKMFQADPMDAEIGREALRRVFGILADEDPPTPLPVRAPQPVIASAESPPAALGPAGAALGSAGRSAAVAPAALSKPEPVQPAAPIAAGAAGLAAAASIGAPSATPVKGGFRLFAPDDADSPIGSSAPLLPEHALAATAIPAPVVVTHVLTDTGRGGRRRNTRGDQRPRVSRDRLSVVLVAGGILVMLVAVFDPHLSILSGGVLPATATAPAIAKISPTPIPTPSFVATPSPTASPSSSDSPSPSPSASPDPTPVITPKPTPKPTPVPTPFPTPVPTPRPTPRPTPKPTAVPPLAYNLHYSASGLVVTFTGSCSNSNQWVIHPDGNNPNTVGPTGSGSTVNGMYIYGSPGTYTATLTCTNTSTHVSDSESITNVNTD